MKKVSVIVGKTTCKRDNQTTLLVRVEGKEMAGGKLLEMVKIVEHCNLCHFFFKHYRRIMRTN